MKFLLLVALLFGVASAQFGFFRRSPQNRFNNNFVRGGRVPVDQRLGNSEYHFSWLYAGPNAKWEWPGAVSYCRSLGREWAPISITSRAENDLAVNAISRGRVDYIWTGGHIRNGRWNWLHGDPFVDIGAWSRTGGFRRPQPDNREGNESCLSILNHIYPGDTITWHDVGCSHRKPTICERRV
ncbi:UNVERIFIED_CONTAM: hypothetical protein RMT77_001061 [Armadillidium vulgare]|nr:hypothetical protein Avbf_18558 [Armadillidium vulgare]